MSEPPELGGIPKVSDETQTLSQLQGMAQQFAHAQFIATSLESSPEEFYTVGWAAGAEAQARTHTPIEIFDLINT